VDCDAAKIRASEYGAEERPARRSADLKLLVEGRSTDLDAVERGEGLAAVADSPFTSWC